MRQGPEDHRWPCPIKWQWLVTNTINGIEFLKIQSETLKLKKERMPLVLVVATKVEEGQKPPSITTHGCGCC